jgi:hypothetical protein
MATGWTALGFTGPNGGKVYVYDAVLNGTTPDIRILENDTLKVSQNLLRETTATMTFYGYMAQQVSGCDEKATFTNEFIPTP